MKGKGLPAYFVQPTQMHKECGLATLDCYGIFFLIGTTLKTIEKFYFRVGTTLRTTKKFIFALERPSEPSRNFIFALERSCCRKKIKKAINKASVLSIA